MAETGGMSIEDAVAAEIAASLKSNLGGISFKDIGKRKTFGYGDSFADNSLTCDSEGNCMLKD